ncbi:uncharacterized protein LOC131050066 [Cryptomeria japonica]|uniref:uncharacterized protein LOC131050066 n=1 Tax=Cryptomeria japonica TaxID=3369 RepID=UPI0027DA479C|nr:uncharacterized protein LOC131050066 [Cryptomeria japonica]
MQNEPGEDKSEEVKEDNVDPESDILFTMNFDTQDINIVLDKETVEENKAEATNVEISESPVNIVDNQQNIGIPEEAEKEQEQNVSELAGNENKNENKNENTEEKADKEEVKDGSKEA